MHRQSIAFRFLYGLLVGIFCWYAYLLPLVLSGTYRNKLIPSLSMFFEFIHVYGLVFVWAFVGSRRVIKVGTPVAAIFYLTVSLAFGADPGIAFLHRWGLGAYLYIWLMIGLAAFFAPALAAYLLLRADALAPRLIKGWRPTYVQA